MEIKPNIAALLLCVAAHTFSCSAQHDEIRAVDASNLLKSAEPVPLVLGGKDGRVQLTVYGSANSPQPADGIRLRAFDEILLGIPAHDQAPPKSKPVRPATLWLDGRAVEMIATNTVKLLDHRSSNDWEFASLDLAPAFGAGVNRFRRHLLYIQPDLVVICDEVSPKNLAAVQTGWWLPDALAFDAVRDEWRLQLPKAGLTVRAFGSPHDGFRLLEAPGSANADVVQGLKCLRAGVTDKISDYRQITVLVPHEKDARRSLAFKLLESDTAIGVRVHRDGLPTLVAFRKSTTSGEANLTGLKFSGPVAVDVFRPKRR